MPKFKQLIGDIFDNTGYTSDLEFWKAYSGLTEGTVHDHRIAALVKNGYTGSSNDQVNAWLNDVGGAAGSPYDNLMRFFANLPEGLTFFKNYTQNSNNNINATLSIGNGNGIFTSARSSSNPSTIINDDGSIDLVITPNTPRLFSAYYEPDTTNLRVGKAFVQEGEFISQFYPNTFPTDSNGDGIPDGWTYNKTGTINGTPTIELVSVKDYFRVGDIVNAIHIKYTGITGDNGTFYYESALTDADSFVNPTSYNVSIFIKGTESKSLVYYGTKQYNSSDELIDWDANYPAAILSINEADTWVRKNYSTITYTDCNKLSLFIKFSGITVGDTVDVYIAFPQIARVFYSPIPTVTGQVTHPKEVAKYEWLGNRNSGEETIVFIIETLTSLGIAKLLDDDGSRRILETYTGVRLYFRPNYTDNSTILARYDRDVDHHPYLQYAHIAVCRHATNPDSTADVYSDDISYKGSDTTHGDWTDLTPADYFYVGCDKDGENQINAPIKGLFVFNRALSEEEIDMLINNLIEFYIPTFDY